MGGDSRRARGGRWGAAHRDNEYFERDLDVTAIVSRPLHGRVASLLPSDRRPPDAADMRLRGPDRGIEAACNARRRTTTARASQVFRDSFEREVDPAGVLPEDERRRRELSALAGRVPWSGGL
jgi:hypothetical protein